MADEVGSLCVLVFVSVGQVLLPAIDILLFDVMWRAKNLSEDSVWACLDEMRRFHTKLRMFLRPAVLATRPCMCLTDF